MAGSASQFCNRSIVEIMGSRIEDRVCDLSPDYDCVALGNHYRHSFLVETGDSESFHKLRCYKRIAVSSWRIVACS